MQLCRSGAPTSGALRPSIAQRAYAPQQAHTGLRGRPARPAVRRSSIGKSTCGSSSDTTPLPPAAAPLSVLQAAEAYRTFQPVKSSDESDCPYRKKPVLLKRGSAEIDGGIEIFTRENVREPGKVGEMCTNAPRRKGNHL